VKKPSRLAILLLVTGVPAFSFWPLVGLFLGPGFIVPLFAATAWLALTLVFLGTIIVYLARGLKRDVRRVGGFWRTRISNCSICGETLPEASLWKFRPSNGAHYESVHPEFWRWNRKWRKIWIVSIVPVFALLGGTIYLSNNGNYVEAIITLALEIALVFLVLRIPESRVRQFRKNGQTALLHQHNIRLHAPWLCQRMT
jgi:hypothetical protein